MVSPLFDLAGISYEVLKTRHPGHAQQVLMDTHQDDLEGCFDCVVSVGGDGIFNEVVSGLLRRAIARKAEEGHRVDENDIIDLPSPSLPVGIIPAGSTDSVALTLHGTTDVENAALVIIQGNRCDSLPNMGTSNSKH